MYIKPYLSKIYSISRGSTNKPIQVSITPSLAKKVVKRSLETGLDPQYMVKEALAIGLRKNTPENFKVLDGMLKDLPKDHTRYDIVDIVKIWYERLHD